MYLNNASFLPPISKAQVPSLLVIADLLVHTIKKVDVLRYGMSPNKMYDYLASAKPIVTSIEAKNNPVVESNAGIAVEPENPKALAEAIIEIYNMPEERRKELGMNGRRYVEQHHSTKILAEKLEALLGWNSNTGWGL